MSPKDIFIKLVGKAVDFKSVFNRGRHNRKRFDPNLPRNKSGYLIENCSEDEREQLRQLNVEDVKSLDPSFDFLACTCEDYYNKKEESDFLKEQDNKLFRKRK